MTNERSKSIVTFEKFDQSERRCDLTKKDSAKDKDKYNDNYKDKYIKRTRAKL